MVIEGDRPATAPQSSFTKLPDGSLIMSGTPKAIERPGILAGLRQWAKERLSPAPAQPAPFWIPQSAPVTAPVPVVAGPGMPLPAYDAWTEVETKAAEQERVAKELGGVSKAVMNSPELIEGKWFSPRK